MKAGELQCLHVLDGAALKHLAVLRILLQHVLQHNKKGPTA